MLCNVNIRIPVYDNNKVTNKFQAIIYLNKKSQSSVQKTFGSNNDSHTSNLISQELALDGVETVMGDSQHLY